MLSGIQCAIWQNSFICVQVVGPMANDSAAILGTYTPRPDRRFIVTPVEGLGRLGTETRYAAGCNNPPCQHYNSTAVKYAVEGAQLVVVCLGLGS